MTADSTSATFADHPLPPAAARGAYGAAGVPAVWVLDDPGLAPLDAFLRVAAGAELYHSAAWLRALRAAGAGRPRVLLATAGDEPAGVLPLVLQPGPTGPGRFVSLPWTPAAGILARDATSAGLLAGRALHLAAARGTDGVWIREFVAAREWPTFAAGVIALDWVRIPLRDVLRESVGADLPPLPSGSCGPTEVRMLGRTDSGVPATVLRALTNDSRVALRAAFPDRAAAGSPLAVWTCAGRHVHVLACALRAAEPGQFDRLLQTAARDGLTTGAAWIDFPCPPDAGPRLRVLLRTPHVRYACERRLRDSDALHHGGRGSSARAIRPMGGALDL